MLLIDDNAVEASKCDDNLPETKERNHSYLPAWLLDMRQKIDDSKDTLSKVNSRLESVKSNTDDLSSRLKSYDIKDSRGSFKNLPNKGSLLSNLKSLLIQYIPSEVFFHVLNHLHVHDILKLELSSKNTKVLIHETQFWGNALPIFCPGHSTSIHSIISDDKNYARNEIILVERSIFNCLKFIQIMKEQRGMNRKMSIEPKRYNKYDKKISHPLPIFESGTKSSVIMSSSETMNKDFRAYSHVILKDMFALTRKSHLPLLHMRLTEAGVITVLVSLLCNEVGTLQSYTCGILGNLLCWQLEKNAYHMNFSIVTNSLHHQSQFSKPMINSSSIATIDLIEQLKACDAIRLLLPLLTSPTASVNLAQNCNNKASTSTIQGMACKEASRALLMLLSSQAYLPCVYTGLAGRCGTTIHPTTTDTAITSTSKPVESLESLLSASIVDTLPNPPATAKSSQDTDLFPISYEDTLPIPEIYLYPNRYTDWKFQYYYKSGSLKDTCDVRMQCRLSESLQIYQAYGRGIDSIGAFRIAGKAQLDITGWIWRFHKQYVDQSQLQSDPNARYADWLGGVEEDDEGSFSTWSRAHVVHTGHWCDGAEAGNCLGEDVRLRDITDIIWGGSIWGVWETCSAGVGAHFELQKGGVYHAFPASS